MQRQPLALIQDTSIPNTGESMGQTNNSFNQQPFNPLGRVSSLGPNLPNAGHSLNSTNPTLLSQQQQSQQQFQRLKVEDALSYLDQVKLKFGSQPQVYNDFLDIMKEFKTQSIDTPGVIHRVSNLFKGHSELIVGFNTFLPPGYKIEVHGNDQVNVTMPNNRTSTVSANGLVPQTSTHGSTSRCPSPSKVVRSNHEENALCHEGKKDEDVIDVTQGAAASMEDLKTTHSLPNLVTTAANMERPEGSLKSEPGSPSADSTKPAVNQPVEFNHAINYVNKIKNRFQAQLDVYKKFLDVLHDYQKEQKHMKEGLSNPRAITESEVYRKVADLFQNEDDLLAEFAQFLPDANGGGTNQLATLTSPSINLPSPKHDTPPAAPLKKPKPLILNNSSPVPTSSSAMTTPLKPNLPKRSNSTSISSTSTTPAKRMKMTSLKDVPFEEAWKNCTAQEFSNFERIRNTLKDTAYNEFLKCLVLYNHEIINKSHLMNMINSFLSSSTETMDWFKEFLNITDSSGNQSNSTSTNQHHDKSVSEEFNKKDLNFNSTIKKVGESYRFLPHDYYRPVCSGRTALCQEVLNDSWMSYPTFSEDSSFVTSKKTTHEEALHRCEDERYEMDVVLELNSSCIRSFETLVKTMNLMSNDEKKTYTLDDSLGGTSTILHQKAIRRLYGDKAEEIIDGLKQNPFYAVPIVLKRLKSKEEEWNKQLKLFNKDWREQTEKIYLKSLDYQGVNIKASDGKILKNKNLIAEIESIFDERTETNDEGNQITSGPHMSFHYDNKLVLSDISNLIIYYIKRLTSINKEDKAKLKVIIRHFIPDLFFSNRMELSDDEDGDEPKQVRSGQRDAAKLLFNDNSNRSSDLSQTPLQNNLPEDSYSLFYGNASWYCFFRLHHIFYERVAKFYEQSKKRADEELKEKDIRSKEISTALKLKPKYFIQNEEIAPDALYLRFITLLKGVIDNADSISNFEDNMREMYGIHAYISYTMDKLIQNIGRELVSMIQDESGLAFKDLYYQEQANGATGGPCITTNNWAMPEFNYLRKAENLLDSQPLFKFIFYKEEGKLTIELLDACSDNSDEEMGDLSPWENYVEEYSRHSNPMPEDVKEALMGKRLILMRNVFSTQNQLKNLGLINLSNLDQETEICRNGLPQCKDLISMSSQNFIYKSRTLPILRRVQKLTKHGAHLKITSKMKKKYDKIHNYWLKENVKEEQKKSCQEWFLSGQIKLRNEYFPHRPPYSRYNRYSSAY